MGSENIPTPAFDREVNVNIRQIFHVHKGHRLYPELPKNSNDANGRLNGFSNTSFSTINTTDVAIIILDAEMFKVQELIDKSSDSENEENEEIVENKNSSESSNNDDESESNS